MRNTRPIPGEETWVTYDEEINAYGVFGLDSGFCYSTWSTEEDALRDSVKRNRQNGFSENKTITKGKRHITREDIKQRLLVFMRGPVLEADAKVSKIIKDIGGNFSGSNEEQMKAVQLLKGLATSDDPQANKFMKALDKATTEISKEMTDGDSKKKED